MSATATRLEIETSGSGSGVEGDGRPPSAPPHIAPHSGPHDRPETENIERKDDPSLDKSTDALPSKTNTRLVKFQLFETKAVKRLSLFS